MEFLDYLEENNIDYKEEDGKIVVKGDLDLCGMIVEHGELKLCDKNVTELPKKLSVKGSLSLWNSKITKLPEGLSVGEGLNLSDSQITKLPNKLSVGRTLNLSNTKITELPEGLSVGKSLILRNTLITKLPNDLTIKDGLELDVETITNISYCRDFKRDNCPLFAAYVNGEIQISFGCFLGNIEAFEAKFYDIYTPMSFNKIKQAARECIKELEEMRKDETKQKKIHELKISPQHFKDVVNGVKTAEIRYKDRDYQVGDQLILQEYDDDFTGSSYRVFITHILENEKYLQKGYVMLSIKNSKELSLLPNPRTIFR